MLYVNSYLPAIGGRELVVHQLAKSYQELGHGVRVVGPGCWWLHRKTKFQYSLHRWPRLPLISKDLAWTIQLFLEYVIYRPDVIHAHSTYPTGFIAARLKKILKFPLIITPHGEDIHVLPEIGFGQRLDPVQDKKIQEAVINADFVTAISDSVAKSISNAGVSDEKIISIPNGVDLERFQKDTHTSIYDYLDIPHESLLVTTIGNYHPRKGHEILIEGIKEAIIKEPRIKLVIVGGTSDKLIDIVNNQGLSEYIKFTGHLNVPDSDADGKEDILAALLKKAIVYVSSSMGEGAEGMSLALLEAMSASTCIVVTDISGNRDLITNSENGIIVPPNSSKAIAEAILQILSDNNMQVKLKEKGLETAKQYDWLEVAKKYIALYEMSIKNRVKGIKKQT